MRCSLLPSPDRCRHAVGRATFGLILLAVGWPGDNAVANPQPTAAATDGRAVPLQALTAACLFELASVFDPAAPRATGVTVRVESVGDSLPSELEGQELALKIQGPDRLWLRAEIDGQPLELGRSGDELWIWQVVQQFGVHGRNDVPRFAVDPDSLEQVSLPALVLPLPAAALPLLVLALNLEGGEVRALDGEPCVRVRARSEGGRVAGLSLPAFDVELWIRQRDRLPARLRVRDGAGLDVTLAMRGWERPDSWPREAFEPPAEVLDQLEPVALSHLTRFLSNAFDQLQAGDPAPREANAEPQLVARHGKGRLEMHDGLPVLFLTGSPAEMGEQHGRLLGERVRHLVGRVLYGVGVGTSFGKERWFFGEIEEAQGRLLPFMDPAYLEEMDALAEATGLHREEVRLANFFPELFHCSGFALLEGSTVDGRLYHGRVLDYMKGVGLEPNATVMVHRPDDGHAWVNIGYAGFVGSVTAMNEHGVSIGEMGGQRAGDWDGKPMAQLVREAMETAETLEQAVAVFERGPRTCEYYYVIADGKSMQAVGIRATPDEFEVVAPGESHPLLPTPVEDTVLLSAGGRYEQLVEWVREGHGEFDADRSWALMNRPVAMGSNIQSVLFAPDTLDFWVAYADGGEVASHSRVTRFNLAELLRPEEDGAGLDD